MTIRSRSEALTVLGLPATATPEDVTRAYRRLAKSSHPDLTGRTDRTAGQQFAAITEAYRALLAPDEHRSEPSPGEPAASSTRPATPTDAARAATPPTRRPRSATRWIGQPPIVAGPVVITPYPPRRAR
jgi:curved DNA-binding protein CbpA